MMTIGPASQKTMKRKRIGPASQKAMKRRRIGPRRHADMKRIGPRRHADMKSIGPRRQADQVETHWTTLLGPRRAMTRPRATQLHQYEKLQKTTP
jgi:hypothetical protein